MRWWGLIARGATADWEWDTMWKMEVEKQEDCLSYLMEEMYLFCLGTGLSLGSNLSARNLRTRYR